MTTVSLIEQLLPQNLWQVAKNFDIADEVLSQDPVLIQLILESKSLAGVDEKQNWFNLLQMKNMLKNKLRLIKNINKLLTLKLITELKQSSELRKIKAERKNWKKLIVYLLKSKKWENWNFYYFHEYFSEEVDC